MKQRMWSIFLAVVFLAAALIIDGYISLIGIILYLLSYILAGRKVLLRALRNITRGRVFDENFLMSLATLGAFIIGEYPEGVAVMVFYEIGELFQSYAVDKSRKSIAKLMDIRPDHANVIREGGLIRIDPEEVRLDDIIVIKAGERIPLDARILEGSSMLDTSALTGEAIPRYAAEGDEVLSGCINISGTLTAAVTKEYGESTVSRILELVENAAGKKSRSENFITVFAGIYTPVVVIIAVLLAVLPPLLIKGAAFGDWIYRAFSFLVVSCPCALVVSIPLSFFGGLGRASRSGILIKGSNYLEALAHADTFVFDKTGTLTKGVFTVQQIHALGMDKEELLELAAHGEVFSDHPISVSLQAAYGKDVDSTRVSDTKELRGYGVKAVVDGREIALGNLKLMGMLGYNSIKTDTDGTVVHASIDGRYAGYIIISDVIKEDSLQALKELKSSGIRRIAMLTGDSRNSAERTADRLGIDVVYFELLPTDKVNKLEELLDMQPEGGRLAYVGDGINDAPVLARADIGIAMGGLGSDAAIEAADVVIMTDEPSKLAEAIAISRKTLRIAYQNIIFAVGIKAAVLILSAFGITSMWSAVFADVGVTVLAVLNSFRTMNTRLYSNT